MIRPRVSEIEETIRRDAREFSDLLGQAGAAVRSSYHQHSMEPVQQFVEMPMIDPVRFKRILVALLKILVVIELVSAVSQGLNSKDWSRFGVDLIIAGVLYVMWERITVLVRDKKEQYRKRMESASDRITLRDALVFSLLWSDEIYVNIPADRRRLVVISYTLIALGLVAAFIKIGSGLMPLVVSGALVLAAVNLLIWVVSLERGEKETLQTEMKLAHDVQTSLMPIQQPSIDGLDIAGTSIPAREVGGDHFDYSMPGNDPSRFGISVFDVSGKGMQAALSAVFTSGAFATEATRSVSPAEILTRLNKAVYSHSKRGHFVAFLLAVFDIRAKTVAFANAGQMKPLLLSGGRAAWLDPAGVNFPLGMKEDTEYQERTVQLQAGDAILLLTDGFTEAMDAKDELFGGERLERLATTPSFGQQSAGSMIDRITGEVRSFIGDAAQHDDMTMVAVRVL